MGISKIIYAHPIDHLDERFRIQIIARRGNDRLLLNAAERIEREIASMIV
jgi:hypothetical protein